MITISGLTNGLFMTVKYFIELMIWNSFFDGHLMF